MGYLVDMQEGICKCRKGYFNTKQYNDNVLVQVPLADWNDDKDIEEEYNQGDAQSNDMEISGSSSKDDISGNTKVEAISSFKKSIFGLISQVERNFEKDEKVYVKAINAFEKTSNGIIKGNNACLQKALFTFGKEIVQPAQK